MTMSIRAEAAENYQQALRAGKRKHRQCVQNGTYPFLQVLDEILPDYMTAGEVNLGLIEIPIDKIVGTKTKGRTNAFSADFMPLLPTESEFGLKWRSLCEAHLDAAGIRDPIFCYEFLGRFYVQEGNKRVSVLKYFGASAVMGNVIRILPGESSAAEILAYREFLSYYPMTKLYEVAFSQLSSFQKLQAALGYDSDHVWTGQERKRFLSGYYIFDQAFQKLADRSINATTADAMLEWLKVYPFDSIKTMSAQELQRSLESMWVSIKAIGTGNMIEVQTGHVSAEKPFKNRRAFSMMPSYVNVAFIHELLPENSNWVKAHDAGSLELEKTLGDQVIVQRYFGVGTGAQAERAMEIAIKNGAEVIFATTAPLITACRRVAARHPETKILNCSVCMPYADVRTYYSRIYEGKFISGAIAGAIAKSDTIGYIASYPIFGVPAGINAFALGAQLTKPDVKVQLKWSCTECDPVKELVEQGIDVISTLDIPQRGWDEGQWGMFRINPDGSSKLIVSPYWNWGAFYVRLVQSILGGDWESSIINKRDDRAVNYWWGISNGVIDMELTDHIPEGIKTLAKTLKEGFHSGNLDPFDRMVVSQDGTVRNDGSKRIGPEDVLTMDWLCDNVIGVIPDFESLSDKGKAITRLQGIYRDRIPPMKESVLL